MNPYPFLIYLILKISEYHVNLLNLHNSISKITTNNGDSKRDHNSLQFVSKPSNVTGPLYNAFEA
jgi:hypothetical protein